ncbi:STAS domain-containing protein [Streptomyces sp. NPDC059740]|uniref:STAS domain-containing protein n=1 Tax=Streptomyces sp. NPDC059740 TaxID=3346926 RepID=UPI00365FF6FD
MSETLHCTVRDVHGTVAVAEVAGDMDMDTAPRLRSAALALLEEGRHHLVLDLSGVEFCDSSGLNVIIGVWRCTRQAAGSLSLVAVPDRLHRLLDITGMAPLLPTYATEEEALRAAGQARQGQDTG